MMPANNKCVYDLQESQEAGEINYCCFVAIVAAYGPLINVMSSEAKSSRRDWSSVSRLVFLCCEASLPRALDTFC